MNEQDLTKFHAAIEKRKADQAAATARQDADNAAAVADQQTASKRWANNDGTLVGLEDFYLEATGPRSSLNQDFRDHIRSLDASTALERLTKKRPLPELRGDGDGRHFRCPWAGHTDNNPSAWLDTRKKVWFCGACQAGGDWFDLAAANFGYTSPGQKISDRPDDFRRLITELKVDFGWHDPEVPTEAEALAEIAVQQVEVVTAVTPPAQYAPADSSATGVVPDFSEGEPAAPSPGVTAAAPTSDTSTGLDKYRVPGKSYSYYVEDDHKTVPTFDVDDVLPNKDTFLDFYYRTNEEDSTPSEFGLWNALAVLSVATSRRVVLANTQDVTANLAICLTGHSTIGKSRSVNHATRLVRQVMGFNVDYPETTVRHPKNPGSGEYLLERFIYPVIDPATNKPIPGKYVPITALVEYEELASFISKGGILGSSLKTRLMDFVDGNDHIESGSMTTKTMVAKDAFATIISTTQNGMIEELFDKRDIASGLLNRFIFAQGRRKYNDPRMDYKLDFSQARRALEEYRAWLATAPQSISMSEEGLDEWVRVYETRVDPIKRQDKLNILGRLDLTLKRLMLLFALNEHCTEVMGSHVRQAESLIGYIVDCFRVLTEKIEINHTTDREEKVVKAITDFCAGTDANAPLGPTSREIQRRCTFNGKKASASDVNRILQDLEKSSVVFATSYKKETGRGPGTQRWRLAQEGPE